MSDKSKAEGCMAWLLWLWLVFVGFFSMISGMLVAGCSGDAVNPGWRECEANFTQIWAVLMIAQGLVIVAGFVLAVRHRLTALVGLAIVSPVLWWIAALFWERL